MQYQPQSVVANGPGRCAGSSRADFFRVPVSSNCDRSFLMEAHDGLPGAIAKRAGSEGLSGSALSIARSLGHRYGSKTSRNQLVDAEHIADLTELPVLVDAYSGFGHCDDARLLTTQTPSLALVGYELALPRLGRYRLKRE